MVWNAPSDAGHMPLWMPLSLFVATAMLVGADLLVDLGEGAGAGHVAAEAVAMGLSLAGAALFLWRWRAERATARRALAEASAEADRWRQETEQILAGLGEAIGRQFGRWRLTAAEGGVGLLLLKGLSMKEIAQARGTSERTVRQQARAVYHKAGLGGRAELSAFFLEDLLLPPQ